MRVFVTGANGQLGSELIPELAARGIDAVGSGSAAKWRCAAANGERAYRQLDITDAEQVRAVLGELKPDGVIHCASWTDVDAAEDPANAPKVRAINVDGARNVAEACKAIGSRMIFLSTDYVFDGSGTEPWEPDCKRFGPLNVYARSKLDGETAVAETLDRFFIVRTAWMFGKNGKNFVNAILREARRGGPIRVVSDQVGTPTWSRDLARLLADMIQTERYGYYHATNEGGFISWYEFAREICARSGINADVIPVTTAEYGASVARRPLNSRLSKRKLAENGFAPLPDWRDALSEYLATRGETQTI